MYYTSMFHCEKKKKEEVSKLWPANKSDRSDADLSKGLRAKLTKKIARGRLQNRRRVRSLR